MNALSRHWDAVRAALADDRDRRRMIASPEESAFLPAALEIIERPVSPTARVTTWVALAGLTLTITWLVFGKIDVVASAQGKIVPAGNVKLVQPSSAGVVRAILVKEGQRVRAGQPLVELDPTVSTAEVVQAENALEVAELDAARAKAVLGALGGGAFTFDAPAGTTPAIAATQVSLARAQLADLRARSTIDASERQSAAAALGEAQAQATKLSETLPLLDEQIAANEQLLAKGYVSRLRVIEMRRQRLAAAHDRDIAVETVRKMRAQIDGAGGRGSQSSAQSRAQVFAELAKAEADARLRREELVKARQRSRLQVLTSPVDGTISQLAVHTVGGVVESAKPIMAVVPANGALVAQVRILNKDIGFVRAGQDVAVKLEAFPFTRYGTLQGRVMRVGSDAVEDEKLGLVYPAVVTLSDARITVDGKQVPITPGMMATADIRTGRRTLLSYLLSPIDEATQEAGRER